MGISTRIEPIDRDIELMISEELSPKAQSAQFAEFAGEAIEEATQVNKLALGRTPQHTVTVDGSEGAPLTSVRPDGVIVAEFDVLDTEALIWIHQQLRLHSPVSEGRDPHPNIEYLDSHKLLADGTEIDPAGEIPQAKEYYFVNTVAYSKKIELGSSSQAPDGVYQVVAVLARPKFPHLNIRFDYRPGGAFQHMPAIVITPRG